MIKFNLTIKLNVIANREIAIKKKRGKLQDNIAAWAYL